MARESLALCLCVLAGCGSPVENLRPTFPEGRYPLAFLLFVRAGTELVRETLGPFALEAGAVTLPDTRLPLQKDEELLLVALSEDTVDALAPDLGTDQLSRAKLIGRGTLCEEGLVTDDTLKVPLPGETRSFVLDRSTGVFEEVALPWTEKNLALSLPLRVEGCRPPSLERMSPFGAEAQVVSGTSWARETESYPYFDGVRIDPDRVVATAMNRLLLIERGRGILEDPAHHRSKEELLETEQVVDWDELSVRNPIVQRGHSRVLLTIGSRADARTSYAGVVSVELGEEGLGEPRLLAEGPWTVSSMAEDPLSGRIVGVTVEGVVITASSATGRFETLDVGRGVGLNEILAPGVPGLPQFLISRMDVQEGSILSGSIDETGAHFTLDDTRFRSTVDAFAVVRGEIWATSLGGEIFRRLGDGTWELVLRVPLSVDASACLAREDPECGRLVDKVEIGHMVWLEDTDILFMTRSKCRAVLGLRIDSGCPFSLSLAGESIDTGDVLRQVYIDHGNLTASGPEGYLLEADLTGL